MISELGLDSDEFALHSLRSGGASQAACSGFSGSVWRILVVSRNLVLQFSVCDLLDKHCTSCVVYSSIQRFTFAQLILMA